MPTIPELKKIAKDNGLTKYSTLKKKDLILLIEKNGIEIPDSANKKQIDANKKQIDANKKQIDANKKQIDANKKTDIELDNSVSPLNKLLESITIIPTILFKYKDNKLYLIPLSEIPLIEQFCKDARSSSDNWFYPNGKHGLSLINETLNYSIKTSDDGDFLDIPENYKVVKFISCSLN